MNKYTVVVAKNESELATKFCDYFSEIVGSVIKRIGFATVALSGGKTPDIIFTKLAEDYPNRIDWAKVIIFWTDERCVPPGDPQSNYGRAYELLIEKIGIPSENIFRVRGEDDPETESERYAQLLETNARLKRDVPCFDFIMLGIGEDGHTASIFPGQENLFTTDKLTAVTVNPSNLQTRITLSGSLINNASNVAVVASGINKLKIVSEVIDETDTYPISFVNPIHGKLTWFLTLDATPESLRK
jgi:6-phosphogluconolactonase